MVVGNVFTRGEDCSCLRIDELGGEWQTKEFNPSINKLRMYLSGSFVSMPIIEIRINEESGSFLLGMLNNFILDDHVINKIEYREIASTSAAAYVGIAGFRIEENSE